MSVTDKLVKRASKAGLSLLPEVVHGLATYFELLRKWNRKVSLTSLPIERVGDEAIDRLLIEPVLATKYLPSATATILDVGSGGGSPAIPMKVAAPGITMRMVESKTRKTAFLREVVRTLSLQQTSVEGVRLEELLARPALHESFDAVTVRAVRIDRKALAQIQSFIRPGGSALLFGTDGTGSTDVANPSFVLVDTHPLMRQWGSRLEILYKARQ